MANDNGLIYRAQTGDEGGIRRPNAEILPLCLYSCYKNGGQSP